MCGIAGMLSFGACNLPFEKIQSMNQAMAHRGPDDEGIVFFQENGDIRILGGCATPETIYSNSLAFVPDRPFDGNIPPRTCLALGHRRLSIIDLSESGHQPMCTTDRRYWIVHNGEIYNFKEIRRELEQGGDYFFSHTDTEVVLKAYRRWGTECLSKFNGMWAFCIWDAQDRSLFCSRDRIGIKPFYYYLTDEYFVFASDIKTLIASSLYSPKPNWEGVFHAMSFHCAPRPMTCFEGVKALEQAHWMKIDMSQRQIRKGCYWQMPVGEQNYGKTENQWKEELEFLIHSAVKQRLISDVPVGVFMSGGVDSTTIAAIAAKVQPGIKAFTLGYETNVSWMDELPQARATAAMWPMEHIIQCIEPEHVAKHVMEMVRCYEEPYYSLAPNYMISRLVAQHHVKVVLNGLGGDELFCGYSRERLVNLWKIIKPFSGILSCVTLGNNRLNHLRKIAALKDITEYYIFNFSVFGEDEKKQIFQCSATDNWDSMRTFKEFYGQNFHDFEDPIEAICYMDVKNYIGNHHVYRGDQFAMNFSQEGRYPFLDHTLVEFACRLPSQLKVKNGVGKYLLKQAARNWIHPSCLSMKKKGFSLPVGHWMKTSLRDVMESGLAVLEGEAIINYSVVKDMKAQFYANKLPYEELWFLSSIGLWLKEFGMSSVHVEG